MTAHLGSVQTEHFLYDAAANLLTRLHTEAPHNQVQGSDKFDYRYDSFGRMVSRYEKGSSSGQRYHYDSDHCIIAVDIDQGPLGYQRAEYRYDILGRRIEKRLWKASAIANTVTYHQHEPDEVCSFGWVGMRLVSEHSSAAPHTTVYHAYNDQSYTPLARIECTDNPLNPQRAIYYTHSSLSGLPEALTNSEGEIVWQGQYSAWGHLQRQTRPTSTFNREQNLRFQGQYFDKETGLHYNTFRYYAPDLGRFTQQDPIGLAGGINLYVYAPNPLTWVDPWGQKGCKVTIGDKKTHDIVLTLTKSEYKEAFGHVADFITKKGNDIFTVDRTGATNRRRLSLQNYSTKTGFDRDEFPMAMFKEGGKGASVRYISISDNRGAGSSISHALSPYPDGTKVKIIVE
ncbi:TPA: RHS repeat-associated core domain-containing protein [Proteus mirabilis]